ncbi:MAG: hypothetical protein ACT4P4_12090 [Betaproteobacteria bacterium]
MKRLFPLFLVFFCSRAEAGGPTDALARIVAQRLGTGLGQQVLVENRGGADGVIGGTFLRAEVATWAKVVQATGARVE